jgi:hypothetical protein
MTLPLDALLLLSLTCTSALVGWLLITVHAISVELAVLRAKIETLERG